ncbi:glycosyltransferase family 4 protein [Mariniflexile litorale]|uniref:Glycosyltransferase family 4 protein n=1 Tax=Mariniflexile litorale TaxID=3045158 RepID=A0AAU7EJ91_9FLAO|nr:glycosyltransferase family 4 protein [Mariniflexile sp. KMM 9835]MDQ8211343.1 glycosyltransferase family 4 protein [Mariniflexile sp. KMM 9835]
MAKKKRIVCVHLLNDFSGSPNMLKTMIKVFLEAGHEVDLMVNKETKGFLSNLNVNYNYVSYNFHKNKGLTLFYLIWFQLQIFLKALLYYKKDCIFIINTIYPCSAAIAARITGNKVVYYIHESRRSANFLKIVFFKFSEIFSHYNIFVSDFIKSEDSSKVPKKTIYNSLDKQFTNFIIQEKQIGVKLNTFNVSFVGSLKSFKGVYNFTELAKKLQYFPKIQFFMMLNGAKEDIDAFILEHDNLDNLHFISNQKYNVHDIYRNSDVLLNLSIPKYWVETFGLTILEGFEYGLPAIVPNIGGPTEIVDNNLNGFCLDTLDIDMISTKILYLYNNPDIHQKFKIEAKNKSKKFSYTNYKKACLELIENI